MVRTFISLLVVATVAGRPYAQHTADSTLSYGFEWMSEGALAVELHVGQTGLYRVSYEEVAQAGWAPAPTAELKLIAFGTERPLRVSGGEVFGPGSYFDFYADPRDVAAYDAREYGGQTDFMLNPDYPLVGDTVTYYLTTSTEGRRLRYEEAVAAGEPTAPTEAIYAQAHVPDPNFFAKVEFNTDGAKYSSFQRGEGWSYGMRDRTALSVDLPGRLPGDVSLELRTLAGPAVRGTRTLRISLAGRLIDEAEVDPREFRSRTYALAAGDFLGDALDLVVEGVGGAGDRYAVGRARVRYPAELALPEATAQAVRYAPGGEAFVGEWTGRSSTETYFAYDIDSRQYRSIAGDVAATLSFGPHEDDWAPVVLAAESGFYRVSVGEVFAPRLPDSEPADLLIVHAGGDEEFAEVVNEYAAFRRSEVGGAFAVSVLGFAEATRTFGYGVPSDARAVRSAALHAASRRGVRYLLLVGKGREFTALRTAGQRAEVAALPLSVLPTYGLPGSDNLLTVAPQDVEPSLAVGRLPVENARELRTLLEKVRAVAAVPRLSQGSDDRLWTKQVIHLGGGANAAEQAQLRQRLERLARQVQNSTFGGEVTGVYKSSDAPISEASNEQLYARINDGIALITFFGHSSPNTFDFNIDNPERYDNEGRYPLMLSLGCYSGDAHNADKSTGEAFILYDGKAAAGFAASVGLAYASSLEQFASAFYDSYADAGYGKPIGDAFRSAAALAMRSSSFTTAQLGEQYTYLGDPCASFYNAWEGPDYLFERSSVSIGPQPLSFGASTFDLGFDIVNLGSATRDSIIVFVERSSATRSWEVVDSFVAAAPLVRRRFSRSIDSWADGGGLGPNRLRLSLTTAADVEPQAPLPAATDNDVVSPAIEFFVRDNGLDLLWPHEYALVPPDSVELIASTRDPFAPPSPCTIELIADDASGQPIASKTDTVNGLLRWDVRDLVEPGRTYYWRVTTPDDANEKPGTMSSFTCENRADLGQYWSPRSTDQFRRGVGTGLEIDTVGNWSFASQGYFIKLTNGTVTDTFTPSWIYNRENSARSIRPWDFARKGIAVALADKTTGERAFATDWEAVGALPTAGQRVYLFATDSAVSRTALVRFLRDSIPDSTVVHLFTVLHEGERFLFDDWNAEAPATELIAALEAQGAQRIDAWTRGPGAAYTLAYRQNAGLISERLALAMGDTLISDDFIEFPGDRGSYELPTLPRAAAYGSLHFAFDSTRPDQQFTVRIRSGADAGSPEILAEASGSRGRLDLSDLVLSQSTNLSVEVTQESPVSREAARPSFTLDYTPLPELAYDPASLLQLPADTLAPGQLYEWAVGVLNVSPQPAALATASTQLRLEQGSGRSTVDTLGFVAGWGASAITYAASSEQWAGVVSALVELEDVLTGDFAETNNYASASTSIGIDDVPPYVTILVDGVPPGSGVPLVSEPTFTIEVVDAGQGRALTTAEVELSLLAPTGESFAGPTLPGVSADVSEESDRFRSIRLVYEPGVLADGIYELGVVASDGRGNRLSRPASLRFEVDTRDAVSGIVPYPNPAVGPLRFVYENTGRLREDYEIKLYSVSGQHVLTLCAQQLGPLRVGRHATDGAWDGTDASGQRLPRGIYLYSFDVAHGDLQAPGRRAFGLNGEPGSGFGKIVLLR